MKEKTKKVINLVFLLLFIISIVIGFSFSGFFPLGDTVSQNINYGKYKFVRKNIQLSTYVNDKEALFNYYPTDVLDIPLDENALGLALNKYEIDTTSNVNGSYTKSIAYSQYEFGNMLNFHFGIFLRIGMTSNNSFNLPIITCNQSTEFIPVIYFIEANETKIYNNGTCIIAEANSDIDAVRIKDRILYAMLGIAR